MASNTELYTSGFFKPVVEKCEGCDRIVEADNNKYCKSYAFPDSRGHLERNLTFI